MKEIGTITIVTPAEENTVLEHTFFNWVASEDSYVNSADGRSTTRIRKPDWLGLKTAEFPQWLSAYTIQITLGSRELFFDVTRHNHAPYSEDGWLWFHVSRS